MSKRSVASATLSFGLVAIPVKFYLTAQAENVSFNMITAAGNRVKQLLVDAVTNKEITRDSVQKGYEYAKGQFVIFSAEELKALGDNDGGSMEIVEFIPADSLDTLHIEKTFYLDAGKGGDKAYRLLTAAMKKQGKLAVAQWSNRGRQHLIVVAPRGEGLVAHQMFYDDEVREFDLDCAKYNPREEEIEVACKLMSAKAVDNFDSSKFTNKYNERVLEAVEKKKSGEAYAPEEKENVKPSGDLMAMLQASLAAAAE